MSATRRSLWLSQLLHPDVSHVVAFGLTLDGELDVPRFSGVVDDVLDHVGWHDVHLPPGQSPADPGPVRLGPADSGTDAVVCVDLSGTADPDAASRTRAQRFLDAPDGADLTAPLFRSELHVLAADRHRWVVRIHHVLTDGAGALRVAGHIADAYAGTVAAGALEPADDVELEAEEQRYLGSRRRTADAEHWRRLLERHEPSRLTDIAGTGEARGRARLTSRIVRVTETLGGPRAASSAEFVTAFAGMCARLLDTPDVGLGLPVAARTSATRLRAVQPVSNVVPLTLPGIGDHDAAQAVADVSAAVVDALRHQRHPREEMLRERPDLTDFGAVVNLLPGFSPPVVDGLRWSLEVMRTGPISDVAVTVHPAGQDGRRAVTWEAPAASFDTSALTTLARRFDAYLTAMLCEIDGGPAVPDDSVFVDDEWERFARRAGQPPPPFTPTAALLEDHRPDDDPTVPAIIDGELSWTQDEFRRRVDSATRLLIEAGVRPGDRVAVCIERSAASVVAFWAVMGAGGVWLPVGDRFAPEARTLELLDRSGAVVGLTVRGGARPGRIRWLDVDEPPESHTGYRPPGLDRGPDDGAYLLFTSGSTGRPKGVLMPHRGIPALIAEIRASYGLTSASRILHVSSPTFDTGIVEMLCGVACGATIVVAPPKVAGGDALADLIRRQHVSHMMVTPSVLASLPVGAARHLELVIVGGETLPAPLADTWAARVPLRNAYGPTETRCSINLSAPLHPGLPISVGPPMTGVIEAVLDRCGRPQPPGARGMLFAAGPEVADGYLDDPVASAKAFVESTISDDAAMYRTGDLATWTVDGDLRLLGRRDDQIKLRGLRVEPAEIDAALVRCPGVRACATVLRELRSGRCALVSFVEQGVPGPSIDGPGLRHLLGRVLPSYMIPALVVVVDELPRTGAGKLNRKALRAWPLPDHRPSRGPEGAHEQLLVEVVGEALGVGAVDLFAGFLEQGGDSLAVLRVIAGLGAAGHVEITPNDVLSAPDLATVARQMVGAGRVAIEPFTTSGTADRQPSTGIAAGASGTGDDAAGERPLTVAERTVVREPGHPDAQLIRVGWVPPVADRPSAAELRQLFRVLADRHPALRSTYPDTAGGPVRRPMAGGADAAVAAALTIAGAPSGDDVSRGDLRSHAEQMSDELDVRVAPPFAVRILTGVRDEVLAAIAVFHHVAVDGQSLAVLARDADAVVRGVPLSACASRPEPVPGASGTTSGGDLPPGSLGSLADRDFTFDGIDPAEYPRASGVRRRGLLDAETYSRFRTRAAAERMTPFEAFGQNVARALATLTGQDRVMAATTVSRRPAGAENTVGDHVICAITPLDAGVDAGTAVTRTRECIGAATTSMELVLASLGRPVVDGRLFPVPVLLGWTPTIIPPTSGGTLYAFPPTHTRWLVQIEGSPTPTGELQIVVTGAAPVLDDARIDQILGSVIALVRG